MNRFCTVLLGMVATTVVCAQAPAPVVIDHVRLAVADTRSSASGVIHSRREIQITAGIGGRLSWLREPGEWVAAGEDLARVDALPLHLERDELRAQIERNGIEQANLERQLKRYQELGQAQYYSEGDLDDLRARRDLARIDGDIARARLRQLDDQIERARIRAPFPGMVTDQWHFAGEEVARGEALGRLVDTRRIELRAQLPLVWMHRVSVGDVLSIRDHGRDTLATIRILIPAADPASQTFELRADLPDDAYQHLAVGQLTNVQLPREQRMRALLVPRDALVLRREGVYVFRVAEDATAERITVEPGVGRGDWIAVDAPLDDGDAVIVRGAERLNPGQAVTVLKDLAAEPGAAEAS